MKHGDFSALAKDYLNRPGYSRSALTRIAQLVGGSRPDFRVADVGAGTGKLSLELLALGMNLVCVEPNDMMRAEGQSETRAHDVRWFAGSAETTGLESASVDWVLMGSSYHWVEPSRALPEFHRILRDGGAFTAVWNPRDLERSELNSRIEARIQKLVPELKRVSSGGKAYTDELFDSLQATGHFEAPFLLEEPFEVVMSRDRYIGVWRSVNDIQVQAGPERWPQILDAIEEETSGMTEVTLPYKTRAYTVRRKDTVPRIK